MAYSKDLDARKNVVGLNIKRVICYIVLVLMAVISILPFYLLIIDSTRASVQIQGHFSLLPGHSLIGNLKGVFDPSKRDTLPIVAGMRNSFIIAAAVTFMSIYFSTLTAYAIHAFDFKLKKFMFTFILLIMMVPMQVSSLGFYRLMLQWHLIDTYWPLILPTIAAPATFYFLKQYMESSLPMEVIEAARIDGSNEFNTFNRIIIPMMKPAIAVQAIFAFITTWNNYFMPTLIINSTQKKTLPILIAQLSLPASGEFDAGVIYCTVAIAIVPLIIVYLFLSKFIIRGIALGSVKG